MFFTYSVCFFMLWWLWKSNICTYITFAYGSSLQIRLRWNICINLYLRTETGGRYSNNIFGCAVDAVCWKCNFKNKSRVINRSRPFQPVSVCCYIKAPWGLDSPPFKLWSYWGFMHIYNDIKWVILWAAATWPVGFNKCIIAGTEVGTEVYHIYLLPFTRPFRYVFNKR